MKTTLSTASLKTNEFTRPPRATKTPPPLTDMQANDLRKVKQHIPRAIAAQPVPTSNPTPGTVEKDPEFDLCGYGVAKAAANKPHIAANTSRQGKHSDTLKDDVGVFIDTMVPISRIAATTATTDDINHDFDLAATPAADQYEEGKI